MFGSTVSGVREALQQLVASLDADVLEPAEAERLVGEFSCIEHVAAAGKALAAGRVAASGRWARSGERSEADWLAKRTGTTVGAARETLDTARRLRDCERTDTAFRAGTLSPAQAAAVTAGASAAPDTEADLLALAGGVGVGKLRDEAARIRAAALPDAEARRRELHRSRSLRTWTGPDGARCGRWRLTPDTGAELDAVLRRFTDAVFAAARAEGRVEPSDAYAADGLLAMARAARDHTTKPTRPTGAPDTSDANTAATSADEPRAAAEPDPSGPRNAENGDPRGDHDDKTHGAAGAADGRAQPDGNALDRPGGGSVEPSGAAAPGAGAVSATGRRARPEIVLLVNLESLRRGTLAPGETCEIPGVGPVALSIAEELLGDSLLKLVIRHGTDIRTVVHLGRHPTEAQRTAIHVRQHGRCARPTCDRPIQQLDHTQDWATTKHTTLQSLAGLCTPDHRLKTHHGHTYRHGPHGWEWHHPDGTIEYERPPP